MAQSTVHEHDTADHDDSDGSRHEHLREVLPALLSVALLVGVVVVGGLVLRDLLDFGVWFLSGWE